MGVRFAARTTRFGRRRSQPSTGRLLCTSSVRIPSYNGLHKSPFQAGTSQSPIGGDDGIRTHDPLLAGQVLSQLSYTPICSKSEKVFASFFSLIGFCFLLFLSLREEASLPLPSSLSVGIELSSRTVSRKVFSPLQSLTSVFGMGTGGPSAFVTPTSLNNLLVIEN